MLKLLHTTTTSVIGKHEALFFNDGHLEIQDPMVDFQQDHPDQLFEHVRLDELEQYRLYLVLLAKFQQGGQHHER